MRGRVDAAGPIVWNVKRRGQWSRFRLARTQLNSNDMLGSGAEGRPSRLDVACKTVTAMEKAKGSAETTDCEATVTNTSKLCDHQSRQPAVGDAVPALVPGCPLPCGQRSRGASQAVDLHSIEENPHATVSIRPVFRLFEEGNDLVTGHRRKSVQEFIRSLSPPRDSRAMPARERAGRGRWGSPPMTAGSRKMMGGSMEGQ